MLLLFAAILLGRRLFQLQLLVRCAFGSFVVASLARCSSRYLWGVAEYGRGARGGAGVGARQHCAQAP